ncbi:hypothetical protein, partial [Escherichia coli]|uniref:hypothetical protein n=1 Tax=Escherichia coli TaxID=562 RepID=UPI001BC84A01
MMKNAGFLSPSKVFVCRNKSPLWRAHIYFAYFFLNPRNGFSINSKHILEKIRIAGSKIKKLMTALTLS